MRVSVSREAIAKTISRETKEDTAVAVKTLVEDIRTHGARLGSR